MEDDATHDARYQYPRVLLKISGESLMEANPTVSIRKWWQR